MAVYPDFAAARARMVIDDIEGRGVSDPLVLRALSEVPRERFVDTPLVPRAYDDCALPIGHGQTISQPYVVALMTEALEIRERDRVLEVGTGTGYAAAVLARIAAEVYTIERQGELAQGAASRLVALGYQNVQVRCGDGSLGWPERAPFDAIVVAAAGPGAPHALLEQLVVGGRLVIPVGPAGGFQVLMRFRRLDRDQYAADQLLPVQFVPLVGVQAWHRPDQR